MNKTLIDTIGNTPLVKIGNLYVKLESANPGGSAKDRAALYMIRDAVKRGIVPEGGTIIEPTSGNTGIGLAWIGRLLGFKVILTMPDTMSLERRQLIGAYGAKIVLTPGKLGMQGAIDEAERLRDTTPGAFIPDQFSNPANALAHYETTGPEIWAQTEGKVDVFVAGVGTGGTITGTGRYLKEQNPKVQLVAVEPAASPLLSGGTAGSHKIQGIGANFIPSLLDRAILDRIMPVTDEAAMETAARLAREEGLLVGISSGAAFHAAEQLSKEPAYQGKTMVVLLPDTGMRYLSTGIYGNAE
ncbi:MAG: cysteine synthase A [Oscillospiraceae bacterium]|nr:cysteine synthase A [Oscillospiraceae bacterium]